jgi:hypothetical protein
MNDLPTPALLLAVVRSAGDSTSAARWLRDDLKLPAPPDMLDLLTAFHIDPQSSRDHSERRRLGDSLRYLLEAGLLERRVDGNAPERYYVTALAPLVLGALGVSLQRLSAEQQRGSDPTIRELTGRADQLAAKQPKSELLSIAASGTRELAACLEASLPIAAFCLSGPRARVEHQASSLTSRQIGRRALHAWSTHRAARQGRSIPVSSCGTY